MRLVRRFCSYTLDLPKILLYNSIFSFGGFENVKCFAFAAQSPLIFDLLLPAVYRLQSFFRVTPLFPKSSYKE